MRDLSRLEVRARLRGARGRVRQQRTARICGRAPARCAWARRLGPGQAAASRRTDRARSNGRDVVYTSWNGATQVKRWRLLAGPRASRLRPIAVRRWQGFETVITTRSNARYVATRALSANGRALGRSPVVKPSTGP
ncbi:MAG: hypothetical protein ACRDQA_18135 [Nocardioidaceae bacterium]